MSQSSRLAVFDRRRAGVLLHPSSLLVPGAPPDRQPAALTWRARRFIDWLVDAGFTVWQVLPLGPTGADGSPYWARSDQAGNPLLVDRQQQPPGGASALDEFRRSNGWWLDDYALYEASSRSQQGAPWWDWPQPLRDREQSALQDARSRHAPLIAAIELEQWQFTHQWQELRAYALSRGLRVYGDLPIYVAPDSVTTWTQRSQFQLDASGRPTAVAGVPPDYFAADGQLWGNPLYDWDRMRGDDFLFWRQRLAAQASRYDVLRIDHFRGLAAYWAVPAGAPTARSGQWRDAPGRAMLEAVARELPDMPFIAEDLGVITPDVEALRRDFHLPGMRVLQFAFDGGSDNPHLPHNHETDCVIYTGTHDNDTTAGWYANIGERTRQRMQDYLGIWDGDAMDAMIRTTLASVAKLAVLPLQDVLRLGSEARFNLPGTVSGNWLWRVDLDLLSPELARHHRELNELYGRS
ncbi:MAG TPA: 4-alpha-glucanotransferase [Steroidobacteraceae bacterium]|nr:4-alpha-glucanotransferase [Steroidobacteraceae bacterium]